MWNLGKNKTRIARMTRIRTKNCWLLFDFLGPYIRVIRVIVVLPFVVAPKAALGVSRLSWSPPLFIHFCPRSFCLYLINPDKD